VQQTRYLSKQTKAVVKQTKSVNASLEYTAYQKLVDYTNEVSMLIIKHQSIKDIFSELDFVKQGLKKGLSIEKTALAWLIINRYEAAFVGHMLGAVSDEEWSVWEERLKQDFNISFVREVWIRDINCFDYNQKFKDFVIKLIDPSEI
ncbi:MAG: hypothetical protein AAFR37_21575, partial [Cyanobacteria bacterium J06628_3]